MATTRNNTRKNKKSGKANKPSNTTQVYKLTIMPSIKKARLYYNDGSTVRNNAGGSFLVYSMRINDLYDPDPAILSGSVSNFKEMMQFYSYYRVLHSWIKWQVINLENFPISCGLVFSQNNLVGSIATSAQAQDALENDFASDVKTISAKGGLDRTTFLINDFNIAKLLGEELQYKAELSYTGIGLATPAIPLWVNFIVWTPTGAVLANGYANSTRLSFGADFFGRTNNRS